jgi:hypothetical protein
MGRYLFVEGAPLMPGVGLLSYLVSLTVWRFFQVFML